MIFLIYLAGVALSATICFFIVRFDLSLGHPLRLKDVVTSLTCSALSWTGFVLLVWFIIYEYSDVVLIEGKPKPADGGKK